MGTKLYLHLLFPIIIPITAHAEIQYVPIEIADRLLGNLFDSGSSVTLIDEQTLQKRQYSKPEEAIQQESSSVYVMNNGGLGQVSTVSMRGLSQHYVKVMYEGVDISDVSSITPFYDFAFLPTANLQKIELLQGSQSTLYSSDAIAGIVQMKSKDIPDTQGLSGSVQTKAGSYGTIYNGGDIFYRGEDWAIGLNGSYLHSDGFSAAAEEKGNTEKDGTDSYQLGFKAWKEFNDAWSMESSVQHIQGRTEYDGYDYLSMMLKDAENRSESMQYLGYLRLKGVELAAGRLNTQTQLSGNYMERLYETEGSSSQDRYEGYNIKLDSQLDYKLSDQLTLALGGDYKYSRARVDTSYSAQDNDINEYGLWSLLRWQPMEQFTMTFSGRYQYHELYKDHLTGRITANYDIEPIGVRIYGSVSTGFRSPSLYELFDPSFGSKELQPEESLSYDIAVEKTLFDDNLRLNATYFGNKVENNILFGGTYPNNQYFNEGSLKSEGVELSAKWQLHERLWAGLNYSYVESINQDTVKQSMHQPKHRFTGSVDWQMTDKWLAGLQVQAFSEQLDYGDIILPGYALVHANISYDLTESFKLTGSIHNVFDTDYTQLSGYGTAGLSGYIGLEAKF